MSVPELISQRFRLLGSLEEVDLGSQQQAVRLADGMAVTLTLVRAGMADDPRVIEHLEKTVLAASQCTGPFVVRPLELLRCRDHLALVEEQVEGIDLRTVLRHCKAFGLVDAWPLLRQIATAVDGAFEAGLKSLEIQAHQLVVQFVDAGLADNHAAQMAVLDRPVREWPPFLIRLSPDYLCDRLTATGLPMTQIAQFTVVMDADQEPGVVSRIARLVYLLVSGRPVPSTAVVSSSAYVNIPGIGERGNHCLKEAIVGNSDHRTAVALLDALQRIEVVPQTPLRVPKVIPKPPSFIAPPAEPAEPEPVILDIPFHRPPTASVPRAEAQSAFVAPLESRPPTARATRPPSTAVPMPQAAPAFIPVPGPRPATTNMVRPPTAPPRAMPPVEEDVWKRPATAVPPMRRPEILPDAAPSSPLPWKAIMIGLGSLGVVAAGAVYWMQRPQAKVVAQESRKVDAPRETAKPETKPVVVAPPAPPIPAPPKPEPKPEPKPAPVVVAPPATMPPQPETKPVVVAPPLPTPPKTEPKPVVVTPSTPPVALPSSPSAMTSAGGPSVVKMDSDKALKPAPPPAVEKSSPPAETKAMAQSAEKAPEKPEPKPMTPPKKEEPPAPPPEPEFKVATAIKGRYDAVNNPWREDDEIDVGPSAWKAGVITDPRTKKKVRLPELADPALEAKIIDADDKTVRNPYTGETEEWSGTWKGGASRSWGGSKFTYHLPSTLPEMKPVTAEFVSYTSVRNPSDGSTVSVRADDWSEGKVKDRRGRVLILPKVRETKLEATVVDDAQHQVKNPFTGETIAWQGKWEKGAAMEWGPFTMKLPALKKAPPPAPVANTIPSAMRRNFQTGNGGIRMIYKSNDGGYWVSNSGFMGETTVRAGADMNSLCETLTNNERNRGTIPRDYKFTFEPPKSLKVVHE